MTKNEQGSTLLIVLLASTLIVTFGLVLLGNTISTAKQTTKTEETIRATHLAEMGVVHLKKVLETSSGMDKKNLEAELKALATNITSPPFQTSDMYYNVTFKDTKDNKNTSTAIFEISGVDAKETKTLTSSFTLTHSSSYSSVEDIESNLTFKKPEPLYIEQNALTISTNETIQKDTQFNENVTLIKGGELTTSTAIFKKPFNMSADHETKKEGKLTINGNAQFQRFHGSAPSIVTINRDAFFHDRFMLTGTNSSLYIKGNSKFHNGFELTNNSDATIDGSMFFDGSGQNLNLESGSLLTVKGDFFIRVPSFDKWFLDLRGTIVVEGNLYIATKDKVSNKDIIRVNPTSISQTPVTDNVPSIIESNAKTIYVKKRAINSNWSVSLDTVEY
ncbi:hypothetical protein [Priestia taiwanensis]|uniref:Uncharacterized protein n=1 Tax=Priestia taiwanensis TaxID=1347902 RepID=A0A917AUN3_9BACI|nr:hypothetical protein [Priestia taiwanensis]MBM7363589.1 hypothetical protein [Priestia taiwanensis]GGE75818.1 hypothetical protein GCM10007140_27000 [Priestia taiwanensis]